MAFMGADAFIINAPLHYVYPCADVFRLAYALQRVPTKATVNSYKNTRLPTDCL